MSVAVGTSVVASGAVASEVGVFFAARCLLSKEISTCFCLLHHHFFLEQKHPIKLLNCLPMELFLKICQM